jgi:hypothetical protein
MFNLKWHNLTREETGQYIAGGIDDNEDHTKRTYFSGVVLCLVERSHEKH